MVGVAELNKKSKLGRPPKDKYNIDYMIKKIEEYIEHNKKGIPILKECCFENDWNYDYVMELQRKHENLSQSTKKLLYLKEVQLEKGMLSNKLNASGAMFSLKQLGWSNNDKLTISHTNQSSLVDALKQSLEGEKEDNE